MCDGLITERCVETYPCVSHAPSFAMPGSALGSGLLQFRLPKLILALPVSTVNTCSQTTGHLVKLQAVGDIELCWLHHECDESANACSILALLRNSRESQAKPSEAHADAHDLSGDASTNFRWEISVEAFLENALSSVYLIAFWFRLAPSLAK